MIDFKTIDNFKHGLIQSILKKSYAKFIDCFPNDKERFYEQWEQEDRDAFSNPHTIGKYLFFACLKDFPIGYCSWDERQNPVGIIGQNCILPEYQGQGYGRKQIELIINIFNDKNFNEIRVITGEHEFFIPAQRIYKNYGFKERQRINGSMFKQIEFYKYL
jgi:GNAT superfamily N-acetyltransferase